MSIWADYLISGIWFSGTHISLVLLHPDSDSVFGIGIKTSEADVIKQIKSGKTIYTIVWCYPKWKRGARVTYETLGGKEILRTLKDATVTDNLDNLLRLNDLYI